MWQPRNRPRSIQRLRFKWFFKFVGLVYIISFHFVERAIMLMKNNKRRINMKLQLLSSPENGRRREMGQLRTIKFRTKNPQRKRLQIRRLRLKNKEKETEMSMALSPTPPSSSSDHSSENYDFLEGTEMGSNVTCLSHGVVSVIGRRREMEDAVRVELGFMGDDDDGDDRHYDFFGVYDGHGGVRVAEACKERLHEVLVEVAAEERNGGVMSEWERVMEGCFGKMDEEVNRGRMREEMVGSTAVVAVVGNEVVVVANCGDSRAVLSRGGLAVPLSIDHKPDRPDERKRVEAAGGRVINWNGPRILGVLATSRSIACYFVRRICPTRQSTRYFAYSGMLFGQSRSNGDQHLKPFVISKPEVIVTKRTEHDEFLLLASDGLWDVVSNEVACQVVRRCFSGRIKWATSLDAGNQDRATRAAAVLTELAMSRGSSDNISVIVVELNKPTKFPTFFVGNPATKSPILDCGVGKTPAVSGSYRKLHPLDSNSVPQGEILDSSPPSDTNWGTKFHTATA